ncbi:hypothetical protein K2173_003632 [Erythroxylum novogranatense]|uniref:DUF1421 domain-containing protein n=1 Tax=Erythroxylum novogranatense TaxID=1862640 RepID=A0AAV8TC32_9ROSI|nr:hypothetical protein K2173_003632 [Erythroxylum novogranatense]
MASGSSGRGNSGSKGFDFGSDDILCSYEDYGNNQDSSNGTHADPVMAISDSTKDLLKNRMARSSVFPVTSYSQPEDSFSHDVISNVEKSVKKHTDILMHFLEGISSRLSQLELYCYNLDKSIGEMRSDLVRDNRDADSKLKSLEKHLHEVHRSVQILRDKHELAETKKELAKLQLVQKESTSSHSQPDEEKAAPAVSDIKSANNTSEVHNQRLALALSHQIVPQQKQSTFSALPQIPAQNATRLSNYYMPPPHLPVPAVEAPHRPSQYTPADTQYRTPQVQDISRVAQQVLQTQVNQAPVGHQFSQYQQQWPQQLPQQLQPQQQTIQSQVGPSSTAVYPTYTPPGQQMNSSPSETLPNSMPIQVPLSALPQPLASHADAMPYGYAAGRTVSQQPQPQSQPQPQQLKGAFGAQQGDVYAAQGPHSTRPPGPYMMYDTEGGRANHPPQQSQFQQGGCPPTNLSLQNPRLATPGTTMLSNPSQSNFPRSHQYNELIDKLVSMGFRGDRVISVIQRMEDGGQPVDFNVVLDRLNVHPSGGSQRGW